MANFPSMPEHSRMRDMLMRFPERGAVLMHVAQQFLRGPSELTTAEREIVFAYGSALNGCAFCHTSHKYTAAELGVDEAMWDGVHRRPRHRPHRRSTPRPAALRRAS